MATLFPKLIYPLSLILSFLAGERRQLTVRACFNSALTVHNPRQHYQRSNNSKLTVQRLAMTQTQHTTRSCSSSNSNNNLQRSHLQNNSNSNSNKSTKFATLLLLLLISCHTAAAATAQSRFFYTGQETQVKVRAQRETNDAAAASAEAERAEVTSCCQGAAAVSVEPVTVSSNIAQHITPYPPHPPARLGAVETLHIWVRAPDPVPVAVPVAVAVTVAVDSLSLCFCFCFSSSCLPRLPLPRPTHLTVDSLLFDKAHCEWTAAPSAAPLPPFGATPTWH